MWFFVYDSTFMNYVLAQKVLMFSSVWTVRLHFFRRGEADLLHKPTPNIQGCRKF